MQLNFIATNKELHSDRTRRFYRLSEYMCG